MTKQELNKIRERLMDTTEKVSDMDLKIEFVQKVLQDMSNDIFADYDHDTDINDKAKMYYLIQQIKHLSVYLYFALIYASDLLTETDKIQDDIISISRTLDKLHNIE